MSNFSYTGYNWNKTLMAKSLQCALTAHFRSSIWILILQCWVLLTSTSLWYTIPCTIILHFNAAAWREKKVDYLFSCRSVSCSFCTDVHGVIAIFGKSIAVAPKLSRILSEAAVLLIWKCSERRTDPLHVPFRYSHGFSHLESKMCIK